MSNVCAAVGDIAMSAGSAAVTVAESVGMDSPLLLDALGKPGPLAVVFDQMGTNTQKLVDTYGSTHSSMVHNQTIITNLNELSLQYEHSGRMELARAVADVSASIYQANVLTAQAVELFKATGRGTVRFADGCRTAVEGVVTNTRQVMAAVSDNVVKTNVAFLKLVLMALGDQPEPLADALKATADEYVERAKHMTPEQLVESGTAFALKVLVSVAFPGVAVKAIGAAAGMAMEVAAVTTVLSNIKVAALAQVEILKAFSPTNAAGLAPMVKAFKELPTGIAVAVKEGPAVTAKALTVVGENPQLVTGGESFAGAIQEIAAEVREYSGTVWDSIKMTDGMYTGTKIPKSFVLTVGERKFWIAPNATEHMKEYIESKMLSHGMPVRSQSLLRSFKSAVEGAMSMDMCYGKEIVIDRWELVFVQPRSEGLCPVIKHAFYTPKLT